MELDKTPTWRRAKSGISREKSYIHMNFGKKHELTFSKNHIVWNLDICVQF